LLDEFREARPLVEIETIEILAQPGRVLQAGIWMIPVLVIGDRRFLRIPSLAALLVAVDDPASEPTSPNLR
jgi:hypothetical protein